MKMPRHSRRAVVGGVGALGALGAVGYGAGLFRAKEPHGSRGVDLAGPVPQGRSDLNILIIMVDQERIWDALPGSLDLPADLITQLNAGLNALFDAEVGVDDGRDMPGPHFYWKG